MTALSPVQFANPWATLGRSDFARSMTQALPPGGAFAGPVAAELVAGCAAAFADLHMRAKQLTEVETVPGRTTELLGFWEYDFGLPDSCTPLGATLQQRRQTLLAKIAQVGGQNAAYYVGVAAALGYAITVTDGAVGSHTWTIHAAAVAPLTVFRAGQSGAGDLLERFATNAVLECVMNQIKPAHTILIFSYT